MKHKGKTWRYVLLAFLIIGMLVTGMLALTLIYPDWFMLFAALTLLILVIGVKITKKKIENAHVAKIMEEIRQKNAEKSTTTAKGSGSSIKTAAEQENFLVALKRISKEYELKVQWQKYASYESIQDVCKKLNAYALKRGIKLGDNTAETLVMAMASSKCIFVKKTGDNTEDILAIAGEFFSGAISECIELETVPMCPSDLLYYHQNNAATCTEFFKKVYASTFVENTVCTCAVKDISQISFGNVFAEFISLFKNPYGESTCSMMKVATTDIPKIQGKKFVIPKNMWFFFLLNGEEQLPKDAALWSETIELKGVGSKNRIKDVTSLSMASSQFNELIEGAFDENFLPLEVWKKLDKVEEYLFSSIGFKIDNILARQIECLTTMRVTCGETHARAMDVAIAHKILPFLAEYNRDQINQEGTTLKEFLDGLFGVENLPECHKMLSVLQLD